LNKNSGTGQVLTLNWGYIFGGNQFHKTHIKMSSKFDDGCSSKKYDLAASKRLQLNDDENLTDGSKMQATTIRPNELISELDAWIGRRYEDWEDDDLVELFDFEATHWKEFLENDDPDSFTTSQFYLHKRFCCLLEEKVEAKIRKCGCSTSAFYTALRAAITKRGTGKAKADRFVCLIEKSTDFKEWACTMRHAAEQEREMDDID